MILSDALTLDSVNFFSILCNVDIVDFVDNVINDIVDIVDIIDIVGIGLNCSTLF